MKAHSPAVRREPLDVESTQTLRALSDAELYDSRQPKWYAIQLVLSDRPVNLDMMPRLEVFAAHRLYAIAAKQADSTMHYALRLGFFADETSAEMTCGHLRTFFSSPAIVRVSTAEQSRFARPAAPAAPVQRQAPTAATSRAAAPAPAPAAPRVPLAQASGKGKKTLAQELLEEAREVQLARSGKKRASEQRASWLTRLFGRTNERPRSTGRR
jgi:hypothetical protein